MYRVIDNGAASGTFSATLTVLGPRELTEGLLRELTAAKTAETLEALSLTPYSAMVHVTRPHIPGAAPSKLTGAPVERLLEVFGEDTILEPLVIDDGRIRVRCLVPQPLDTRQTLAMLQEIQRTSAWSRFRVIRVNEFKAIRYLELLRRILTPEQEDLLRLALSLGYYSSPKGCTLEDIAKRVGLSVSPVHKKLKAIEQVLINAQVDPLSVTSPERRRRTRNPKREPPGPGQMVEVTVRVRWNAFPPIAYTAEHEGTRVVLHPLREDEHAGIVSLLIVAAGTRDAYEQLIASYESHPHTRQVVVTAREPDHASLKVEGDLVGGDAWSKGLNPFGRLLRRFGRETFMRPLSVDGGDLWWRFTVLRGLPEADLRARLEAAAKEGGWDEAEVVSVRPVDTDPASAPIPQPDKLTARQEEVLRIAHALGYYKTPREATLEQVAQTLGISANAIHKNLTAAEQKIICAYLLSGA